MRRTKVNYGMKKMVVDQLKIITGQFVSIGNTLSHEQLSLKSRNTAGWLAGQLGEPAKQENCTMIFKSEGNVSISTIVAVGSLLSCLVRYCVLAF